MSILQMMMAGLSLEYEGVITSGDLHIATKDGDAMFFHDSINFSTYAGTDGGSTPYRLVFTDSAGKVATAYGGAAGGGEALGSEILTNGDMEAGDPPSSWTASVGAILTRNAVSPLAGTYDANVVTNDSATQGIYQGFTEANGRLIKISAKGLISSGRLSIHLSPYSSLSLSNASMQLYTHIGSVGATTTTGIVTLIDGVNKIVASSYNLASNFNVDDLSMLPYTDVPATGLHLMSAKNGTTRNMASVETGFNPNAIVGVKIYG